MKLLEFHEKLDVAWSSICTMKKSSLTGGTSQPVARGETGGTWPNWWHEAKLVARPKLVARLKLGARLNWGHVLTGGT